MALKIFELIGSIMVDNNAANESISKTENKAGKVGETLSKGVKTAAKWSGAIVGGAAAAVTGLSAMAMNSANAMDTIDKMSAKIGISKQGYQEWSYVLGQNGMDVDKLQVGIKTLVTQMDGAASGNKNMQESFSKLGLSIYDSRGKLKDQEAMMNEVMYALADMENGTEKARLATELFGKAGIEMMPMLNNGSKGIKELTDRAHELGLVVSDDAVTAGVVLGDTVDDIKKSFGAIVTKLGNSVVPIAQKFADFIVASLPKIQKLFDRLSPVIQGVFDKLLPPLMDLATTLFPVILSLVEQAMPFITELITTLTPIIGQLLQDLLPPLVQIAQMVLPLILNLLEPLLPLLQPLLELLNPILQIIIAVIDPLVKLMDTILTPIIGIISALIGQALKPLNDILKVVADVIGGVVTGAFDSIQEKIKIVKDIFGGLIDFVKNVFTGNWKGAWESVKKIFSSVFEGIKSAFKSPINFIIKGINAFIRGINKIQIPDWVPLVGGMGFSLDELPLLAKGGTLTKGSAIVGENGPEIITVGNGKTQVTPLTADKKEKAAGIGSITVNIDKFINNDSERDIDALVDLILYKADAKVKRRQAAF